MKRQFFLLVWLAAAPLLRAAPGDIDPAVNLLLGGNPATVVSMAIVPDGRLLFGGYFTSSSGQTRNHLARMNPGGLLETAFNPNVENTPMVVVAMPDGGALFAGYFLTVGGTSRIRLARLNANGSLDTAFNPSANDIVYSAVLLPEGRVLIGGLFTSVSGTARSHLARLNADGSLDTTFNTGADERVRVPILLPDGKIVIGGNFTTVGGQPRTGMARLNADGSVDTSFNAGINGPVYCAVLLPDGKILAGGTFTSVGGAEHRNLVRLTAAGTVDATFTASANALVRSFALQTDGKTLIGGEFTQMNGAPRNRVARLNADGSLDSDFTAGANTVVSGLLLQSDGKVLVGGEYSVFGSQNHAALVRLVNDPATQSLTVPQPDRIQWLRGGTSPEANEVSFDLSIDEGNSWLPVGLGTRISGGWEAAGADLSRSGLIRARARIACGIGNTSSSLVETITPFSFTDAEFWRFVYFGTITEEGDAASNADPDHDGLENLIEYAFLQDPLFPDTTALPQWQSVNGDYTLSFTLPSGVSGISCMAESNESLDSATWLPLPNTSTPPQFTFRLTSPSARQFLRLRVTSP